MSALAIVVLVLVVASLAAMPSENCRPGRAHASAKEKEAAGLRALAVLCAVALAIWVLAS